MYETQKPETCLWSKQNQRNSWSRLKVTNLVNHCMHTNQIYLADLALVQSSIVGQFQLPKHYILLHPVGTGTRGVRMQIDTPVWKQEDISYMLHAHTGHFLSRYIFLYISKDRKLQALDACLCCPSVLHQQEHNKVISVGVKMTKEYLG